MRNGNKIESNGNFLNRKTELQLNWESLKYACRCFSSDCLQIFMVLIATTFVFYCQPNSAALYVEASSVKYSNYKKKLGSMRLRAVLKSTSLNRYVDKNIFIDVQLNNSWSTLIITLNIFLYNKLLYIFA